MRDVGWFADDNLDGIPDDDQICIQQGSAILTIDTATGNYIFFECSKGLMLSGTGVITQNSCKMQLTHFGTDPKRPDRNVNVLINPCTLAGTGSISFGSPTKNYSISDNNTNVGNCNCTN